MILGRTGIARKGNWVAAAAYDTLDIVTHEGKVYISKRFSTGSEPSPESADWVMLPDAPGFEIEETASGYDLTITGSDGTSETISILNGEVDAEELIAALESFQSSADAYFASDYDDEATYSAGDYCIYEGLLYRCKENILTAEPWTAEHWERAVLANMVAQARKDVAVKADVVVNSAEPGDVVTIADGADNVPVKELVVGVEPVQDLHGYDNPWPAGGGKNLFNANGMDIVEHKYINNSGAEASNSNANYDKTFIPVLPSTSYTWTGNKLGGTNISGRAYYYDSGKTFLSRSADLSHDVDTITTPADCYYVQLQFGGNSPYTNDFSSWQFEKGSATSYAPYSNLCPISGWTGVEVEQSGKNRFDVNATKSYFSTYIYQYDLTLKPNTNYTCSCNIAQSSTASIYLNGTNSVLNGVFIGAPKTAQTDENGHLYILVRHSSAGGGVDAYSGLLSNTVWCQLEEGSTATAYEAFNGNTYPISWQSEAGTVYGCHIDPVSGVLTVEWASRKLSDFSGTLASALNSSGTGYYYRTAESSILWYKPSPCMSDTFKPILLPSSASTGATLEPYEICCQNSRVIVCLPNNVQYSNWNDMIANSGFGNAQLVFDIYPHAEYQLTPTQIATLLGTNVFWSNSNGGIRKLLYVSDLKLYLEQLTKTTEDDMTANSNIPANTYFTVGNALYLSTAAIAAGEKIEPDTNCIRKSLADALNDLQDQ